MAACRSWPVAPQGWVAASRSRRPASSRPKATAGSSPRNSDFFRFHVFWGDCWRESPEKNTYLAGSTQLHRTLGLGPAAITLSHHHTVDTEHEKHVDSEPGCSCPRQCCSWWLNRSGEAALQLYLLLLPVALVSLRCCCHGHMIRNPYKFCFAPFYACYWPCSLGRWELPPFDV